MFSGHNRAFKEWAVACDAMREGRQTALIRKGGIREEEGVFRLTDPEFFLMPTFEHQNPALLQPAWRDRLGENYEASPGDTIRINSYAVVDTIFTCEDEERLQSLEAEHVWNHKYLRMRLNFNPYDPLYVLILRVFRLPETHSFPMRPEYGGCRSWVTLNHSIPLDGAEPAIPDAEFERRRTALLAKLVR